MRSRKRNWFLKRMVLGFAVAALVAPAAAQARVDEGIAGQPNSTSEISGRVAPSGMPHAGYNDYLATHQAVNPQARMTVRDSDAISNGGAVNPQARMTVRDSDAISNGGAVNPQARMTVRDSNATSKVTTPSVSVVSSPGFDWNDAGVGFGLAFGLILLGLVAYGATRRIGSPQTA
jgi:hypothetical protein